MARANTVTWLSLDRWAELMGYNRYHFNGVILPNCNAGVSCGNIWYQYMEQSGAVTREELASAIKRAEETLSGYVNYNLMPDWSTDLTQPERYYHPAYRTVYAVDGRPKSVQLNKRWFIAGGTRASELVEADVVIERFDRDNDGFLESCRIPLPIGVDTGELHLYYPEKDGSPQWEIRPITITSTHIVFPVWLIVRAELIEENCVEPLDGSDGTVFLDTVDVYRVYNDPTTQVKLIYDPQVGCSSDCAETYLESCMYGKNHRLAFVAYNSAGVEEPDKLELFYYSGYKGGGRPYAQLCREWEHLVAILAASLLDKKPCNCCDGNECQYVSQWMTELDRVEDGKASYQTSKRILENEFGIANKGTWYTMRNCIRKRVV